MKTYFIAGLFIFFTLTIHCQTTAIPDANFEQALIDQGIDSDGIINGQVLTSDISSLTELNVSNSNISDLTGIEDFTSLTSLSCYDNNITDLDLQFNTALFLLSCFNNNISSLNIANNTALYAIDCKNNNISTLSVANLGGLNILWCQNNNLSSLDVTNNTSLSSLLLDNNQLTSLDVQNGNNTNLDFSALGNPNLFCISVDNVAYSEANWANIDAQTIFSEDCTAETDFVSFSFAEQTGDSTIDTNNHTIEIEVVNGTDLSNLIPTFQLFFGATASVGGIEQQSGVTANDYSAPVIYTVTAEDGVSTQEWTVNVIQQNVPLTLIPDSNFEQALIDQGIDSDGIINGQVLTSNISSLESLYIPNKNISDLTGIEDFVSLNYLFVEDNNLTSLNVDNNTALLYLWFSNNSVNSINLDNNTALIALNCSGNNLNTLNVANNTAIESLYCSNNNLNSLNIDNNTALTILACQNNNLTSLDVDNNTALTYLACNDNNLSTLNVDNNTALTELFCFNNNLSSLNVDNNTALTKLYCNVNNLNTLNIKNGNNLNITEFAATGNPNLLCIQVDDAAYSTANWSNIDAQTIFSEECNAETDFISFSFAEQTGDAFIDTNNHTIEIEVVNGTDLSNLIPTFQLFFGASASVGDIEQQSGATANDYSAPVTYTVTAANGTTIQEWVVYVNEGYCSSNGIDTSYEYIGRVQLGTIDNTSQAGINGYQDFTSISTDLYRGSLESIFITPTFPGGFTAQEGYSVWIDYNQDGDFEDEGEMILSRAPTSDLLIESQFYIDSNALPGLTRMRVSMKWQGIPTSCETFDYGEVEDYSVNIVDGLSPQTDFYGFWIPQQVSEAIIDNVNHTISIAVSDDFDISALTAEFWLINAGATTFVEGIEQQSGTTINDFTNPVTYTVLAEDGVTSQEWVITVTQEDVALTYVPDQNFEFALIELGIDSQSRLNSYVLTSAVTSLTSLDVSNKGINDLTGIEDFVNLTELQCSGNSLTSLNVDNNIALTELGVSDNNLTSLNLSNNEALISLACFNNSLTELDISNNVAITFLLCSSNNLSTLDVSNNTALESLLCGTNSINTLNLENNAALTLLRCQGMNLQSLDVSNNLALNYLWCYNNDLSYLNVQNGNNLNFVNFDSSGNANLECIQVDDAAWSTTNWTNIDAQTNFSENCENIWEVFIPDTNLGSAITTAYLNSIDTSGDGEITFEEAQAYVGPLDLSNQGITNVTGLQAFTGVTSLDLSGNNIADLSILTDGEVVVLNRGADYQNVSRVDYTGLLSLDVSDNQISKLDVSAITTLESLDCSNNRLEVLNVKNGNNSQFTSFSAINNPRLYCVVVDDSAYATTNWLNIDTQTEFNDTACYARLLSKVFFQGPYDTNTGLMSDALRNNGLLPDTSPYADALTIDPSVLTTAGTNAIVDWVWVEIRDAADGTTVIASRSVLLQADGDVVDLNGSSPLVFDGAMEDYFITLSHRNHLGVITVGTFNLEEGVVDLDLRSNSSLVTGGTNAIKDMGDGNFALYAADFDGNGQVQNSDLNGVLPLLGISAYSFADIDMNGQVQNTDINILLPNLGLGSQAREFNSAPQPPVIIAPRRD